MFDIMFTDMVGWEQSRFVLLFYVSVWAGSDNVYL